MVEPKEIKSSIVDTTENVEEAEDKKMAAEKRVQPNEEISAPVDTTENVEEAEDKKREEAEKRELQRKKGEKEDGAWKKMVTAGNLYIATSAGEEGRKNKKEREHMRLDTARVAGSSAVNQQKQADKVESVKAKEEKTAPVDHEKKTEEAEDKKLAAVQRVEDVEEEDKKLAAKDRAAKDRSTQQQKTNLQGQRISTQEAILVAEKGCKKNEVWDENQSQQWGGTGTSAQEAIIITSQSPAANKTRIAQLVTREGLMFTFLMNK